MCLSAGKAQGKPSLSLASLPFCWWYLQVGEIHCDMDIGVTYANMLWRRSPSKRTLLHPDLDANADDGPTAADGERPLAVTRANSLLLKFDIDGDAAVRPPTLAASKWVFGVAPFDFS